MTVEQFLLFHQNSPYYLLYVLALNTGMRLGEITGLQWDMVDLERRVIRVARTYSNREKRLKETTKGKRPRSVPVDETLHQLLVECHAQSTAVWVITQPNGNRLCSNSFTYQYFRKFCRDAGVKEIRFHDLRHTFASHYMMNGGNLYELQQWLGHRSIDMTNRYAHLSPAYLQGTAGMVEFGKKPQTADNIVALAAYKKARSL